jgi:hypothetical protein
MEASFNPNAIRNFDEIKNILFRANRIRYPSIFSDNLEKTLSNEA